MKRTLSIHNLSIRKETPSDYQQIKELIIAAFEGDAHSDGSEHLLVERLRKSKAYKNELALVYEEVSKIIGHILITEIVVVNQSKKLNGLSLAPISVSPHRQNSGIGTALINEAHTIASQLNYPFIVLIGHETYYPRFGYESAETYNIKFPFDVPSANCMIKPLRENALDGISGMIEYPEEFYD